MFKIADTNFYTAKEVAKLINKNVATVLRWIRDKKLHAVKKGKNYFITEDDLRDFFKGI